MSWMGEDPLANLLALAEKRVLEIKKAQWEKLREKIEKAEVPAELLGQNETSDSKSASELIRGLSVAQRIKLALLGNSLARMVLIRDSNRQVALFVMDNPRLTENEVVEFARNQNLDELILREIARSPQWTKSYAVKVSLVSNPKTPVDVALSWLKHLRERDLRNISRSKNVSSAVAQQSRKLLDLRNR